MDKRLNQYIKSGFSLLEVLMALTIFSFFIMAFMLSQGSNISNSTILREDVTLHNLAELKINEVLLDPPQFTNATENDIESKNFDLEDFKKYKYTIEYKKIEIPDISQIMGLEEGDQSNDNSNNALQKMVFTKLKKNIEEMLWQVRVTVTNTETDYSYELSTWLRNEEAQIDTNFTF